MWMSRPLLGIQKLVIAVVTFRRRFLWRNFEHVFSLFEKSAMKLRAIILEKLAQHAFGCQPIGAVKVICGALF
eukprot:m.150844 g.150844  ORF g.150844 m.150844 type:complete len:73 (+) comp30745_c0_seq2:253-471(+)